jgi:hypothetical protein
MSQQKIVLDGTTYIRSRDAARIVQLAPNYVSRLARGALIDGRQIDGLWFVDLASLKGFIIDQERQKDAWRAHLAQFRREEQRRWRDCEPTSGLKTIEFLTPFKSSNSREPTRSLLTQNP